MVNLRAKKAERAAEMFKRKEPELATDEDLFFDAKEFHTSNKEVANILSGGPTVDSHKEAAAGAAMLNVEGANWGDEEEIDIDENLIGHEDAHVGEDKIISAETGEEGGDIFVPPSQGADPLH